MPLVGASSIYRPPVAGEPLRLREDGHWSTKGLVGYWPMREGRGTMVQDYARGQSNGVIGTGIVWGDSPIGTPATRHSHVGQVTTIPRTAATTFQEGDSWGDARDEFALVVWARLRSDSTGSYRQNILRCGSRIIIAQDRDNSGKLYFGLGGSVYGLLTLAPRKPQFGQWEMLAMSCTQTTMTAFASGDVAVGNRVDVGEITQADWTLGQIAGTGVYTYGPSNGDIWQPMIYRRALGIDELNALSAAPDLPIWRPRRGISLALLGETMESAIYRPRPQYTYRMGPRMILGGVI